MAASTPATVRKQIASGKTGPIYLIIGSDEDERTRLAREFADVVEEELRPFNVERLYGGETEPARLLQAVHMLPMLGPRRIVIVSQAELVLSPKKAVVDSKRDLEALEQYVQNPSPQVTVIFESGDLDKRRRVVKALLKHATVVTFPGIKMEDGAQRWVCNEVKRLKLSMDAEAVRAFIARTGADLPRLRADFERLVIYASGQATIGRTDVEAVVGPAVLQDNWAITRAIEQGKAGAALRELALLFNAGVMPLQILGQLGWFVRERFASSKVKAAVDALYRTDLALKSSRGDGRIVIEQLVLELCGVRRNLRRG
ncbi:MAG: DNA polymerase III subunit delta [Vicinamibacterales bacterium]|jgi:DNA polymerase-3 subunit delta|nr:DNA polymerase III subunit delta [Vicinamibacterales bacterium]HJO18269.1 DNA polymerase III subunit delta [Vicinamibacterales bacterium]|tara:strand:+ start:26725 stop:27666 length:942 start_codon:yes stop_codon:yes gene_type:complete